VLNAVNAIWALHVVEILLSTPFSETGVEGERGVPLEEGG